MPGSPAIGPGANVTTRTSSSTAIVTARVLLLAMAAAALVVPFVAGGTGERAPGAATGHHVCPMHPQVTSPSPGDCSICRMALEPAPKPPPPKRPRSENGRQKGGKTEQRQSSALPASPPSCCPSDSFVLPADAKLRRFGAVARVKKFETALEMRAPAWAESAETGLALMHLDEQQLLTPDESALFFPATRPTDGKLAGVGVHVTREPPTRWDGTTTLVRFHVDAGARLLPGQTGSIKFAGRVRNGLVVRDSAVLDSAAGPYVLVVGEDRRTLTPRRIEVGNVHYGYAALISGLQENEYVAAQRTFFLDAERRRHGGEP